MTEKRVPYMEEETDKKERLVINDKRNKPIFIHGAIDDMTHLTPNAKCVYMHLARRADNRDGRAWPSYQSIGDHCFLSVYKHPDSRRKAAIDAVKELIAAGLIEKEERIGSKGQITNTYNLLDLAVIQQSQPGVIYGSQPGVTPQSQPAVINGSPKGTPIEGNPINEGTPKTTRSRSSRGADPHPNTKLILESFITALGYNPPNFGKEGKAAKELAKLGFTPEQVIETYWQLKREFFWKHKYLSLSVVLGQIQELNNYAKGKGVENGQAGENTGYNQEEIAAIRTARRTGDKAEVERILRAANARIDAETNMRGVR